MTIGKFGRTVWLGIFGAGMVGSAFMAFTSAANSQGNVTLSTRAAIASVDADPSTKDIELQPMP